MKTIVVTLEGNVDNRFAKKLMVSKIHIKPVEFTVKISRDLIDSKIICLKPTGVTIKGVK